MPIFKFILYLVGWLLLCSISDAKENCSEAVRNANQLFSAGDWNLLKEKAQQAVDQCEKEKIQSAPAYVVMGSAYLKLGDTRSALSFFKKASFIDPKSEVIQINLCSTYATLNDSKNAKTFCEQAAKGSTFKAVAENILSQLNSSVPATVDQNVNASDAQKQKPEGFCLDSRLTKQFTESMLNQLKICKKTPKISFNVPVCTRDIGEATMREKLVQSAQVLANIMELACQERADVFNSLKTLNIFQSKDFDRQYLKIKGSEATAHLFLGLEAETVLLQRNDDLLKLFKEEFKKSYGITFETEEEKKQKKAAESNAQYDRIESERKRITKQIDGVILELDGLSGSTGKNIAAVWSDSNIPAEKKANRAKDIQDKADQDRTRLEQELEKLKKQREDLH